MIQNGSKIFFYVFRSVLPYTAFAWLLLTVILFIQQAGRYSDLFFGATLPGVLFWQLAFALIPNVIAFTSPMAALVGVTIGLSRLREDSEMTSLYSAGIGNFRIGLPILSLGFILTILGFWVNLQGVPMAAKQVKRIILQATAIKFESPIEPGSFNTSMNGFVVYVKDGDFDNGLWKNLFAISEGDGTKPTRIITAETGKLDYSSGTDELVLGNALITTIPTSVSHANEFVRENVGNIRFNLKTKRQEFIEKLANQSETPEELGLAALSQLAVEKAGKERFEAQQLFWRKITLSLSPLIFAWLAFGLTLFFNQIGRGSGGILAFGSLIIYYLLALGGEQMARSSLFPVWVGSLIPMTIAAIVGVLAFIQSRKPRQIRFKFPSFGSNKTGNFEAELRNGSAWRSVILDRDFASSVFAFTLITLVSLISIYHVFTVFELWKFAIDHNNGVWLLSKYLYFLSPLVVLQILPSAFMVAIIIAYTLKSRRHELTAWTASGQSVYRLLLPCAVLAVAFGLFSWFLQENITPNSNRKQDMLRTEIRGNGNIYVESKKFWFASGDRIFSFDVVNDDTRRFVTNPKIYEIDDTNFGLNKIYSAGKARFEDGKVTIWENAKVFDLTKKDQILAIDEGEMTFESNINPFGQTFTKPTHLDTAELSRLIGLSTVDSEKRSLLVSVQKRFVTPFLPLCVMLFIAPFAMEIGRKRRVISIAMAIGLWLIFIAVSNVSENLGNIGAVSPIVASWAPILLFTAIGLFLLSRIKT